MMVKAISSPGQVRSTVFPLAEAVAEMFIDEGYAGNVTIDSIGSGAGFERFLRGRRDRCLQCQPPDS
ncbi:MAG: hypothetical protein R2838_26100 [Caldilineaceae bacterium]